jgi:hypothetical protein
MLLGMSPLPEECIFSLDKNSKEIALFISLCIPSKKLFMIIIVRKYLFRERLQKIG